jgi:hypothetical protein
VLRVLLTYVAPVALLVAFVLTALRRSREHTKAALSG